MENKNLKTYFFFLLTLFINSAYTQGLILERGEGGGSFQNDKISSLAVDMMGNVYVVGDFKGTVDFDPGPAVFNLTSTGNNGQSNLFVRKLDAEGRLIWVKQIGGIGTGIISGQSITVDTVGNVYLTGYFGALVDFDPGSGVSNLFSTNQDIFICKLDTSGNYVWARQFGDTGADKGNDIVVDLFGNVFTIGSFQGTIDFDPGTGIANLSAVGLKDIFISKLDSSGNYVWAAKIGGIDHDYGNSISVDKLGNVYTTGVVSGTIDFDPGVATYYLNSNNSDNVYLQKLGLNGELIWAQVLEEVSPSTSDSKSIMIGDDGHLYITGSFSGAIDFDPSGGSGGIVSAGGHDVFVGKYDTSGTLIWVKGMGGPGHNRAFSIAVDNGGNVYTAGVFENTANFDPDGIFNLTSRGFQDVFISKLDVLGNFVWAEQIGSSNIEYTKSMTVDNNGNIYVAGYFLNTANFSPNGGNIHSTSEGLYDFFLLKLIQKGVTGCVYQDFNEDCMLDPNELGLSNRILLINPGGLVVNTDEHGQWFLDSLPLGTYTVQMNDRSNNWISTCPPVFTFNVTDPNGVTNSPCFGFVSSNPCVDPDVSLYAPFLRPGFSDQKVYIQVCNDHLATDVIDSGYVIIQLDSLLSVQAASTPYISLGGGKYSIGLNPIYPDECENHWLSCSLSTNAILGQTLCMSAELFPIDTCVLDSNITSYPLGFSPCNTAYDFSHLVIRPTCNNDTISFVIHNLGDGNMTCFSQVRLYVDGVVTLLDSIQLTAGDTAMFVFLGDGRTWRLEVDQHPLHLGSSQPSATIELCGPFSNWTPDLVNVHPQDDADSNIDIYCGLVTGSYDPNDKTGYPLGFDTTHDILPYQDMEYIVRFQNTGTDTAFTVVIRDTLSTDLDIFTVRSGVSSHDYSFKIYGPRVLEWTFNNIMLPDSNINEPASHGFIKFKVHHAAGLVDGEVLENSAAIYFDFNPPIITNTSWHRINDYLSIGNYVTYTASNNNIIKVFPNPSLGVINLQIEKDFNTANIQVLNTLGQVISSTKTTDLINQLDLPIESGFYIIRLEIDNELYIHKVMRI